MKKGASWLARSSPVTLLVLCRLILYFGLGALSLVLGQRLSDTARQGTIQVSGLESNEDGGTSLTPIRSMVKFREA